MIRKTVMIAALGALAFGLTACNTIKGAGRDIQSVGEAGNDAI
ncbi:entericidin A/B family lipoprotein [Croceicoccus sp. YJ47]|nr:entericidin A/B family lipoprotein [Croceicoccus sp. YJ47]QQN73220.1 entericidin A/B family lipoprotein [Croceicoccus sp. YJ47]